MTTIKRCKKCNKNYYSSTIRQKPGFRNLEDETCPYCGEVNCSSMEYEFYTEKI